MKTRVVEWDWPGENYSSWVTVETSTDGVTWTFAGIFQDSTAAQTFAQYVSANGPYDPATYPTPADGYSPSPTLVVSFENGTQILPPS